jgi:hypothetical protein
MAPVDVVILPIAVVVPGSVNHGVPLAPAVNSYGTAPGLSPVVVSVIWPEGVIFPIALVVPGSVNHRLPSSPATIACGMLPGLSPALNSVI